MKERKSDENGGYTEVFAWGSDRFGQLGIGNKQGGRCYCIPRFCSFNIAIKSVSCGDEHSAFITGKGQIFTFGNNSDGRLGLGDKSVKQSSTPCLVEALSRVTAVQVSCGSNHTAAILDNGDLYTWGLGEFGALGLSSIASQWVPVKVLFSSKVPPRIVQISSGTRHTSMVDDRGRLFTTGSNDSGQLGTGTRAQENLPVLVASVPERIQEAACGINHTLILATSGKVYATGGNTFGQLGIGSKKASKVPIEVRGLERHRIVKVSSGHHSAALNDKGEAFIWGTGVFGEFLEPMPLAKLGKFSAPIIDVSIGGCFGVALDKHGAVYSWGANSSGELGVGDYNPRATPCLIKSLEEKIVTQISCGASSAIALGQDIGMGYEKTRVSRHLAEEDRRYTQYEKSRSSEVLAAIKAEQRKKRELDLELEELRRTQEMLLAKEKEAVIHEQQNQKTYKEELTDVENRISLEKEKGVELYEVLQSEQNKVYELETEKATLETKLETLEAEIRMLESEGRGEQGLNERLRINEVLKEYEEKIERERSERLRLEQEKVKEISGLKEILVKLEIAITEAQKEKSDIEVHYNEEVKKYKELLEEYQVRIKEEERIQENLTKLQAENEFEIEETKAKIQNLEQRKSELLAQITELNKHIDKLKETLAEKQNELDVVSAKCDDVKNRLQSRTQELATVKHEFAEKDAQNYAELDKLRRLINDKTYDNSDLESRINLKQSEIDTLQKDVEAWKRVTENLRLENDSLRGAISELEDKNRKLSDTFKGQEWRRIKESEGRTIQAIRTSASPMRIQKILSKGTELQYTSPNLASRGINPVTTPDEGADLSFAKEPREFIAEEPVVESTEKLVKALGTESPIRKKVAKECLSPDLAVPRVDEGRDYKSIYEGHNKTGTAIAAVNFVIYQLFVEHCEEQLAEYQERVGIVKRSQRRSVQ
eukprot:TRINITY_DN3227_c0_g1_i1.p1 TRINITY_DN3227_c0_g1~~TRINITY_DN3227_c0_g1_i1.p1  ORF type:complete len:969 (-),score=97.88 TRINITY_DN3227_c0_g1_i1:135-2957(-)